MISVHATPARRVLLRTVTGCAAVILLTGFGGLTPRALAQADDKADKTGKTDKTTKPASGILTIGEDTIDRNQPIKPAFTINVSVEGEPDPSGNYKVDSLGNVSIRYAGIMTPVNINGLGPDEAANIIAKFLKTYIKNPHVQVTIVDTPARLSLSAARSVFPVRSSFRPTRPCSMFCPKPNIRKMPT